MTRMEEYQALRAELETAPEALENTVEGFIPAAQLCRGEAEVIEGVRLLDPLTGKQWTLGDPIRIRVAGADVALGRIDFDFVQE